MARKKGEPKRAPEYKKKAEGAKCYTRPTKSGGSYVSCEGKQTGKAVRSGPPPKGVKQTGKAKRTGGAPGSVPKGSHRMRDGKIMKDKDMPQTGKAVRSGPPPKGVKQTGKAKRTGGSPAKAEAQREWDILGANPISQTTSSYEPVQYFD